MELVVRRLLLLAVLLVPSMAFALPGLDLPDLRVPPLDLNFTLGSPEPLSAQTTAAAVERSLLAEPGSGLGFADDLFGANLPNVASSSGDPVGANVSGNPVALNLLPADLVPSLPDPLLPDPLVPGLPDPLLPNPLFPGLPNPLLPPDLVIPEPGTALLLGSALLALGFARRRR